MGLRLLVCRLAEQRLRKQLLWWVVSAKRPETRQKRIERIVADAAERRNPLAPAPKEER